MNHKVILITLIFLIFTSNSLFAENVLEITWQQEGEQEDDQFGKSVASLDFNGDSIDDFAISAPRYSIDPSYPSYKGRIYIFYGSINGLSDNADWVYTQEVDTTYVFKTNGSTLVKLGDTNNDGCDDLGFIEQNSPVSSVYNFYFNIVLGDVNPDTLIDYTYEVCPVVRISPLGDINGDGYDDIGLVEKTGYISPTSYYTYFIIYGGSFEKVPFIEDIDSRNGIGFRGLGDINADGYDEFSYYYETDAIVVQDTIYYSHHNRFFWGETEQDTIPDYSLDLLMQNQWAELTPAGDWNGDGYADFAISGWELTGEDQGGCRLWLGGEQIDWDNYYHIFYFSRFTPAFGDINNDGKGDLVKIYQYYGLGGYLYFFLGDQNGTPDYDNFYSEEGFGFNEAIGDFNNDGFDDIAAGARGDNSLQDYGNAFVFAGHSYIIEQDPNISVDEEIISNPSILFKAHPNPFNPIVNFEIKTEDYENLQIEIFNIRGQKVILLPVLLNGINGTSLWNAENQASGIYFCNLVNFETKAQLAVQKITLLK